MSLLISEFYISEFYVQPCYKQLNSNKSFWKWFEYLFFLKKNFF